MQIGNPLKEKGFLKFTVGLTDLFILPITTEICLTACGLPLAARDEPC
jgi:hypothetical protein